MRSPVAKGPILCEWAGFSCPPSWPPIGWHFLETGSLHPPPAALRRFPCPPGFAPHSLPRTRRAGCPHPTVPDLHRTSCKRCHCEASAHTGCGNPHPPVIASGGALSANSGRKCPKNAAKTNGFGILCAPGMHSVWKTSYHAHRTRRFTAVLSRRLCATIRWPLTRARAALARRGYLPASTVRRDAHTPPPIRTAPPGGAHHTSGRGRVRPYASQENTPHRLPTLLRPITKK